VELSRRLSGRKQVFGMATVLESRRRLADHRLTKILVLAWFGLHRRR